MDPTPTDRPAAAEEHLARFRATGDPDALGALFDATAPALFRIALRLAPDPAAAEDALQETFLALFDAAREWDPGLPALPWLAGVLRHRVSRVRRDGGRRPDFSRLPPALPAPDPADAAAGSEARERVRRALLDLPEPYRSVALLRWRYGLEPSEIAEVRGEPPGTVWSLLSRAKERLEKSLAGSPALTLLSVPGAGLAAVRAGVVRHAAMRGAAAGAGAGAAKAAAGGILVGKKTVAVAAILLVLGLGTWLTAGNRQGGVRGRVVDAQTGRPIAGARVGSTAADGDGRFALPETGKARGWLATGADGFVSRSVEVRAGDAAEIRLERGDTVTGRILGPGGAPVAGARVSIHPRNFFLPSSFTRSAVTDAAGRFRCECVDRENYHNCVVRAEGLGRLIRDFNPSRDGPAVVDLGDLRLPAARRIEGVLLSGRGKPMAAAGLGILGPLELERACRVQGVGESARTDAEGRFRFEGLGPGRYRLSGDREGTPGFEREVDLADGDLLGLEIRLEQTGWLRVLVVDRTGSPVPGVKVTDEEGGLFATSGEDGVAVLENLKAGRRVRLTVQGGSDPWGDWPWVDLSGPAPPLPDGGQVTLTVAKGATIRGVVLDERGDPVERASVGFVGGPTGVPAAWGQYGGTTREDGTFVLSIPEGETVDLGAGEPGDGPPAKGTLRVARAKGVRAPAQGVVLRLRAVEPTGSLTVRLLDPTGLPVAGLDIEVIGDPGGARKARTGADGLVALQGLYPIAGLYGIAVPLGPPGEPQPLPAGAALPAAVKALPDGRVVVFRMPRGASLAGTVLRPDGSPAAGARVVAGVPGRSIAQGIADDAGRFRLTVAEGEPVGYLHASLPLGGDRRLSALLLDLLPGRIDLEVRLEGE